MRVIFAEKIKDIVAELCIQANLYLRKDILRALKSAYQKEDSQRAKDILGAIIKNSEVAEKERLALCQDTGLPVVFLEIGQEIKIKGNLKKAINKGLESGYKKGFLRNSIVNPLKRDLLRFSPGIIHTEIVKGNRFKITILPKGFGCENETQLKMFNPLTDWSQIKRFIVETVRLAGPDACPPYIVGVGIGGTSDYACFLAKKALLKKVVFHPPSFIHYKIHNMKYGIREMEYDLLNAINRLNIGPMGLGGRTTALAVNINIYPTHIAGLPVAVNISCHALRSATKVL
ncbi:MAG: fumarate hydratase [Candidatus Omnitrophica bacterium]|nr:fumarate hydratase [Candidatus Omnitrophota bacterium]